MASEASFNPNPGEPSRMFGDSTEILQGYLTCNRLEMPESASLPGIVIFMDELGGEFVVTDKSTYTYSGYMKQESFLNSGALTFLPFKTKKESWGMFKRLVESPYPRVAHWQSFIPYEDEWLTAVEHFITIESYFTKKMNDWKSVASRGNDIVADKADWFKFIEEDFTRLFLDVIRLCWEGIDDGRYDYIYTNLERYLVITNSGGQQVKFLPIVDWNDNNNADFEKLQKFMSRIIGLPFDVKDVVGDLHFNLPRELASFLYHLSNDNLNYMGPKFLLSAPFTWSASDKYKFVSILDSLVKRLVILEDKLRTQLEIIQELNDWKSFLVGYPVLLKLYANPSVDGWPIESYRSVVDIVRFCSNVYWDYNLAATRKLDRPGIEKELSSAIPNLYVSLFEALILYARCLPEREPVFDKAFTNEELW